MDEPLKIEKMTIHEVAAILGTSPMKIKSGILNGTMPIGTVLRDPDSTKDRIIILRPRFEAWIAGKDLGNVG